MKNRYQGFSLIEVMVVVVIIGIISSIAYPSYMSYVLRTNRTAAGACLIEVSQFMERSYTAAFSYVGVAQPALQCVNDLSQRYAFALTNQTARTYTANATPIGAQVNDDCGVLTLNQAGAKGANGGFNVADVRKCW